MLFRGEVIESVECKPGQIFRHRGEYYLLAYVGNSQVALVSLTDGNRWIDAVTLPAILNDITSLSRKEWDVVTGSEDPSSFVPVKGNYIEIEGKYTIE